MSQNVWFGEGKVWGVGRFGEWGGLGRDSLGRYVVWEVCCLGRFAKRSVIVVLALSLL